MKIVATNKKAHFEYFVLEKYVAGVVLVGSEVKSIRAGHVSIEDTYVSIRDGEAWVINMYIKPYEHANNFVPAERRARKLLLNRSELNELIGAVSQKGQTVVPLRLYFEGSLVKLEIAICKGKKLFDKRETIKQRDLARDRARELKN
ncbi:MAG: SsrA-binding protein SmpB [Clostridia bacterium]|nr:SsrA-binding protein SmpB [Clostridia bacterium]